MRISDEIDALEVMGISGMPFLCATRLLAAMLVLPFVYLCSIGAGFFASYLAVVQQIGYVSSGGFFLIFWQFQNPPDLLFSLIKAMSMAIVIVIVGCYYGYNASGGPVGWVRRPRSRWCSTSSPSISSACSGRSSSGVPTREHQSEAKWVFSIAGTERRRRQLSQQSSRRRQPRSQATTPERARGRSPQHRRSERGAQRRGAGSRGRAEPAGARGADQERGPDGGEIEETPTWEEARGRGGRYRGRGAGRRADERAAGAARASRSWTSQPPRPEPPSGASDDEYKWHTYKVYPSGRPDAVEFIDTYKSFGRSHILRGLNMGLPEGMVSMILGPVGNRQVGLHQAHGRAAVSRRGRLLVHGKSVPNMPDDELFDMRKKFGLLFQDGALFGSMNLYDNVAFPLRQHTEKGEDEVEDIVMRRLNEVGLGSARTKMPNELSGGMRKRAGFARALVLEPDIVLFDEPDSGLDPVRTALLGELILEIHRDMMDEAKEKQKEHLPTFCVITHDIMSARRVADYINVLWKGRIVEAGPAEDMLNSENPFIRQFLSGESQGPLTMD